MRAGRFISMDVPLTERDRPFRHVSSALCCYLWIMLFGYTLFSILVYGITYETVSLANLGHSFSIYCFPAFLVSIFLYVVYIKWFSS